MQHTIFDLGDIVSHKGCIGIVTRIRPDFESDFILEVKFHDGTFHVFTADGRRKLDHPQSLRLIKKVVRKSLFQEKSA